MRAGLRIKETKEVYEGEVTELAPEETENVFGGYQKASMYRGVLKYAAPSSCISHVSWKER